MITDEIFDKILNREDLSEDEIRRIIWEDFEDSRVEWIDEIEGDCGRWTRGMQTIFSIDGKLYAIDWEKGLTEYQENEYWDSQPYRVKKHTRQITVTDYVEVKE